MGDRLTQLQECFDQLATQMFASLRYINTHHAASPIPGQQFDRHFPSTNPTATSSAGAALSPAPGTPSAAPAAATTNSSDPIMSSEFGDPDLPPRPDSPNTFAAALRELSRDLVIKEQQIEMLIGSLPGIGRSRGEQEGRLRGLEEELRLVEEEVRMWEGVKGELVERVEGVIGRVWRP